MVNHLAGHAPVDADVFARDKARLVRTEEKYHVCDVHGVAHAAHRLLHGVGAGVELLIRVNPPWRDGVDPCLAPQRDGQGMREGGNATLGRLMRSREEEMLTIDAPSAR